MIYRDALGRPEPRATICIFGSDYGKVGTGYFSFCTTSDAPVAKWPYESKDVSHIISQMEEEGWECEVGRDGYGCPTIDLIHVETQKETKRLVSEAENKFAKAKKGYVRFGDIPKSGRSWNHRDNIPEAGVSVFEAEFVGKEFRVSVDSVLEVSYISVMNRPVYRIWGEVVGTGADGEPLLRVTRKMRVR